MEYLTLSIDCGTIRTRISNGWISFESIPPGADIYIIASGGGSPINTLLQTPNIMEFPAGDYDYILKLAGYKDYTGTKTIDPGTTTYIIADLIPIPTITPVIIAASGVSVLGLLLATTTRSIIPLTTGKLGGEIVAIRL